MNFRKHMPRLLLCLLLALLATGTALAADADDFIFEQNGDSYTVVAYTGSASEVRVPDWYNGLPVTRIGPSAFEGNKRLTTLLLPSSITRIGSGAFRNCASLTTISTYTAHTEHIWDEGVVIIPATCAQEGLMRHTCTLCPTQKAEPIPVTDEHAWDEGVVTQEPTETETGLMVYTCTLCGATRDEILPVVSSRIPGDANDDGRVNARDALLIQRYAAGWDVDINLSNGDVNGDDRVNARDALIIQRYAAGWDVVLQ